VHARGPGAERNFPDEAIGGWSPGGGGAEAPISDHSAGWGGGRPGVDLSGSGSAGPRHGGVDSVDGGVGGLGCEAADVSLDSFDFAAAAELLRGLDGENTWRLRRRWDRQCASTPGRRKQTHSLCLAHAHARSLTRTHSFTHALTLTHALSYTRMHTLMHAGAPPPRAAAKVSGYKSTWTEEVDQSLRSTWGGAGGANVDLLKYVSPNRLRPPLEASA
jgi:hypothetical protein